MIVFGCARCGAELTVPVSRVALPAHAHQRYGHELLPALMESGTYAVDPEPFGPPWRLWSEVGAEGAAARGVFAPVPALSFGAPGAVVVAPGDVRGTVLIPERCDGYCLGLDGRDGPNLACARCGRAVATRVDDCTFWQTVWLAPEAVQPLTTDGSARPADWEALTRESEAIPPVEPGGWWDPRWEAAVGVALAHLLAASEGVPVDVPEGLLAETFGRALDILLPAEGAQRKMAALAGPGLSPPGPAPDIALVPRHPGTGETWQPPPGIAHAVPLAADVWLHLAFHAERSPLPLSGDILRDEPPPPRSHSLFRPDSRILLAALARLPAVREPWLRAIYDRVNAYPYRRPF
ncbi:conserved hypothetical protein [Streptomyces viridochromogenes DSM 40736]|uniref:Uncharacterized protein n=1 Tax=Streptomyces viridochromogenes (strain DSM 40736 / JCM 4977 / BCRC 1201 / Tue 494) TaxID=591159 RepID=D9X2Q1_STRVT|nr:hypothetical protein [Streptomyces viridochromogenes]EFL35738.1 conserved hypothetical protein [Streptomyces viridochromogenes DSM 40736]